MNETPPTPDEWYSPAITFDTEDDRRRFQQMLVDKRHFNLRLAEHVPPDLAEVQEHHIDVLERMLDKMGRDQDPVGEYVFETPAELTVALTSAAWLYDTISDQEPGNQAALDNVSELAAVLAEAHWKDDPFEDWAEAEELIKDA